MALSRRTLLKSAARRRRASRCPAAFRAGHCAEQAGAHRHPRAALRHRRGAGENSIRATQWAVERFNAAGGIAGRKVELVIEEEVLAQGHDRALRQAGAESRRRSTACRASSRPASACARPGRRGRRARSPSTGTAPRRMASTRKIPNPRYLFRSTRQRVRGGDVLAAAPSSTGRASSSQSPASSPDYSYSRNNMAAFIAILKRFSIEHQVVTEQWPKVGTMDLTSYVAALKAAEAGPDLLVAAVRRPAGVHEAGARRGADRRAPSSCSRRPAGSTR